MIEPQRSMLALLLAVWLTSSPSAGLQSNSNSSGFFLQDSDHLESSCASIQDCQNCSETYTCHWCEDQSCHAKGSVHGCAWGSRCQAPKPKENSTCASHTTCSECALSSHLCHWCEHDNACHVIGSRFGCTVGVDCYSNDRCRRKEPEKFGRFVLSEIPWMALLVVVLVGAAMIGFLSCCYCFWEGIKEAYNNLAAISMRGSVPPSVIGGTLLGSAELEPHPDEEEEQQEQLGDATSDTSAPNQSSQDEEANQQVPEETEEARLERRVEHESNHYVLMDDHHPGGQVPDTEPLLHPSNHSYNVVEESRHLKILNRMCSIFYYISVSLVLGLVIVTIYFYPMRPIYDICNDELAWKKIIENIVVMRLDASFEILISVSNPNHIAVSLDKCGGSFTFEGNPVGTFEIPGEMVEGMAITDLMLIARVTPNRHQAVQMANAYYKGNLVLEAEFTATLRVPALFDFTYNADIKDITVYVNELSDRSLCHCPSWDNGTTSLPFL